MAELKDKVSNVFVPLSYDPAEAVQIDWGEATVILGGIKQKIQIWCMRECHSGDIFVSAFIGRMKKASWKGYDTSNTLQIKADDFSLVRFDHNKYSVPYQYSSKMITVKGSGNQVIMLFRGEIIAKYDRDYRHNQTHYCLEHYIGLIEKRPRSVYNAAPIKKTVPTELYQFLMKLSSPKEIVKVLRLYLMR